MKLSPLFIALSFSAVAMAATPLPPPDETIPLVVDGVAIHDPALNVLIAMQVRGCITLDINPISYTWHQLDVKCP